MSNIQEFSSPVTLTLSYFDGQLRHFDPASLTVMYWDDFQNTWQQLSSQLMSNSIAVLIQHPGNYILASKLLCPQEDSEPNDFDVMAKKIVGMEEIGIHVFDSVDDVDWFSVQLNADTKYQLSFTNVADGTLPQLEIFAADGVTLLHSGSGVWTPEQTDIYYLKIYADPKSSYGCSAVYELQVEESVSPTLTATPTFTPTTQTPSPTATSIHKTTHTPIATPSPTASQIPFEESPSPSPTTMGVATATSVPTKPNPTATPIPTKPNPTATVSDIVVVVPPVLIQPADNITIEEGSKLTYQWQSVANATSYEILQLFNPGGELTNGNRVTVTGTTYSDELGHTPGLYSWEVMAKTEGGLTSAANRRYFSVAPHNPGNLQVTATGCQTTTLTWQDNSAYETAYYAYRNGAKINEQAALNGGSGQYQDSGLAEKTVYEYKVVAHHPAASLAGVTISVETPSCPVALQYTLSTLSSGNGSVTISKPGPYPSGTQIQLTAVPDSGWRFVRWESTESLGDQTNLATITVTVSKDATYTAYFEPDEEPNDETKVYLPLINR